MGHFWCFFVLVSEGYFKIKDIIWEGDSVFRNQLVNPNKQKAFNFCLGVNIFLQRNISVFVLFHELYPLKETSTVSADRDGVFSAQDFITALHKMDLELSVEEAHFLFQTNHLPLSLFRSIHPGVSTRSNPLSHCKPGTSSSFENCEVDAVADSDLSPSILPSTSPTFTTAFPPISPTDSLVEQNNRDAIDAQSISLKSLNLDSDEEKATPNLPVVLSHRVSLIESVNSESASVQGAKDISFASSTEHSRNFLSFNEITNIHHQVLGSSENTSQRDSAESNFTLTQPDRFFQPVVYTRKTDTNSWIFNVTQPENYAHRKSESSSSLSDLYRRESLDDNKELISNVQCSPSSDSELDYKFDWEYSLNCSNQNFKNLKSVDGDIVVQTLGKGLLDSGELSRTEHKVSRSKYIDKSLDKESQIVSPSLCNQSSSKFSDPNDSVYEKCSSSTCSSSVISKRPDRYIRDIDVLEVAGVPFSYEDVVYSTNEEFRNLRATRGLTEEQLTAMSDARRRATNRQAAERCRRSKVAARDELAERLADLRLQRQALTKRLFKARQLRRNARDNLTEEQNRLLHMLHDSNGCTLKPSDWRIHLTTEDEIVVVSVGH